jgi:hypothetical protein
MDVQQHRVVCRRNECVEHLLILSLREPRRCLFERLADASLAQGERTELRRQPVAQFRCRPDVALNPVSTEWRLARSWLLRELNGDDARDA